MNHIFKVIFNRSLRTCVVCAEICKSLSKSKVLKTALSLALPVMTLLVNEAWAENTYPPVTNNGQPNYKSKVSGIGGEYYFGIFWNANDSVSNDNINERDTWQSADRLPNTDGTEDTKRGIAVLIDRNDSDTRAYGGVANTTINDKNVKKDLSLLSSNSWDFSRTSGSAITNENILYLSGANNLSSIRGGKVILQ